MKRVGGLMPLIAEPDNLREAFLKAARGKHGKADCRTFQSRLDENLETLRQELLAGEVRVGDYHRFTIFGPKERTICAASFGQRVLHHAVMAVCEPVLERAAVFDSYACRKGKGRLAAVERPEATPGGTSGSSKWMSGNTSIRFTTRRWQVCSGASSRTGRCWRCSGRSSAVTKRARTLHRQRTCATAVTATVPTRCRTATDRAITASSPGPRPGSG